MSKFKPSFRRREGRRFKSYLSSATIQGGERTATTHAQYRHGGFTHGRNEHESPSENAIRIISHIIPQKISITKGKRTRRFVP